MWVGLDKTTTAYEHGKVELCVCVSFNPHDRVAGQSSNEVEAVLSDSIAHHFFSA